METATAPTASRKSGRRAPSAAATPAPAVHECHEAAKRWPETCPERRQLMIQEIAYLLAEKRGFAPGGELQDWLSAEAEVDQWFECEHFSGD